MKTAQIIQHPGALDAPVVQQPGPGRRPRMVIKMRALQVRRDDEIRRREVIAKEIESVKSVIAMLREHQSLFEKKLRTLTAPGMTKEVRNDLVSQIEMERWNARLAGSGQVVQTREQ